MRERTERSFVRRALLVVASVLLAVPATVAALTVGGAPPAGADTYVPGRLIDGGDGFTCAATEAGTVRCWGANALGQLGDATGTDRPAPVDTSGLTGVLSVTAEDGSACALKVDGTVWCWGDGMGTSSPNGLVPGQVTGLPPMVRIEGRCGVGADGSGWCWSTLSDAAQIAGLSGVTWISKTCAVITGGALRCWGDNAYGQLGNGTTTSSSTPVEPTGAGSGYVKVASSGTHVCAIATTGGLRCWGRNQYGQVGNTTTNNRTTPATIGGLSGSVATISLSPTHTCASRPNGLVLCWGLNASGQLGTGTTTNLLAPGAAVTGISNAKSVGVGSSHSCAVLATGEARCWGLDLEGALGDGAGNPSAGTVVTVTGGNVYSAGIGAAAPGAPTGVTAVGGVRSATVSWTAPAEDGVSPITGYVVIPIRDGTPQTALSFAGSTATTQVLHGIEPGSTYTFRVAAVSDVGTGPSSDPSAGVSSTPKPGTFRNVMGETDINGCGILAGGGLACWAGGTPQGVAGWSGIVEIGVTYFDTCGLTTSQRVRCRSIGPSGDGLVPGLTDGVSLAVGSNHACVARANGEVICWGDNTDGQLGDGTTTPRSVSSPATVAGITDAVSVTAGTAHSCARLADGSIRCWGRNLDGQLGNGTTTGSLTPVAVTGLSGTLAVAAGYAHTCAVTAAGSPTCWGKGTNGSLGNGGTASSSVPVTTSGGITGATALAAAGAGACVVTGGGALKCWGLAYNGTGSPSGGALVPTTPTGLGGRVDHIGAGPDALAYCAVLETGEARCWGWGETGAIGNGTGDDAYSPVPIGGGPIFVGAAVAATAPGAPTIDSVTVPENGKVTVAWSPPDSDGGAGITNYTVTPYLGGVPQPPLVWSLPTLSTTFTVPDGGSYTFEVAATNPVGTGPASALSSAVVVPPGATGPPAPTVGMPVPGNASVTLSWTPTGTGGSPITGYLVTPILNSSLQTPISFDASTTTRTITGLTNGGSYAFRVQAVNAAGPGVASPATAAVVPCRCIRGLVVSQVGDVPVANARVRALLGSTVVGEAFTGADGRYVLPVATDSSVVVQYADPLTSPQRFPVGYHTSSGTPSSALAGATAVAPGAVDLLGRVALRAPITGTVVDNITGNPVQGLRVSASINGRGSGYVFTAADGSFSIPNLVAGTSYEINVADTRVGASPAYQQRWYVGATTRAGATLVPAGSAITLVAVRR